MLIALIVSDSIVISVLGSLARFPSTYFYENYGIMHKKMLDGNAKRTRNAMEKHLSNKFRKTIMKLCLVEGSGKKTSCKKQTRI